MPITAEQAALWSPPGHADSLHPIPQGRLTVLQCRQILDTTVAVVRCFVPAPGIPAIFLSVTTREQHLCTFIMDKEQSRRSSMRRMRDRSAGLPAAADDGAFRRGYGHENEVSAQNTNVPFLRLMYNPDAVNRMLPYIREAVQWMTSGGSNQRNFVPMLYLGFRDWETSSAWTRGETLIAARAYKERVAVAYLTHLLSQQPALVEGREEAHSLAHAPSLTSRQAQRSGVSQSELRARWA
ncbi:hypothetical protein BCR35DRAFT_355335 [Leucosporidium creatinivorum]|uniref:Uncharacterized protein n=1 Tax=Leucosporidium creatinivorum TaxID=106004 RepID=A0A1Y2DIG7_9BASI|nr:hypothetical protein BCR35DRAFT_355335 [Leucosporidium creatinivorum]